MRQDSLNRLLRAGALAAVTALASAAAYAGPFGSLVVFGDSLSDNGNNSAAGLNAPGQVITGNSYVPSFTYASKNYSNGPVWADYFATLMGVPLAPSLPMGPSSTYPLGGNFAFGGAVTGSSGSFPYSLREQAGMYLMGTGNVASPNALYVIAGGGNNVRAAITAIGGGADPVATATAAALAFAADVGFMVDQLQAAGAQHIVVWNAPNVGLAPAVVAAGGAGAGTFVAATMNGALTARLAGEAGVSTFDLFGYSTAIAANPAGAGLTNVTDACGAISGADCSTYAYWDGIHPTTAAHAAIANAMVAVAVPEPETYALMALGLVFVAWRGRRARSVA